MTGSVWTPAVLRQPRLVGCQVRLGKRGEEVEEDEDAELLEARLNGFNKRRQPVRLGKRAGMVEVLKFVCGSDRGKERKGLQEEDPFSRFGRRQPVRLGKRPAWGSLRFG